MKGIFMQREITKNKENVYATYIIWKKLIGEYVVAACIWFDHVIDNNMLLSSIQNMGQDGTKGKNMPMVDQECEQYF